jgi:calcium-translocating P-type ATPase
VPQGLTTGEAAARLAADGPNLLSPPTPQRLWRKLLAEVTHFFALMLWVASFLAFVAGMAHLGIAIAVIIVVNGIFAFVQGERAEYAAARLRDLLPSRVVAMRDGQPSSVDVAELVVGDLVVLSPGDRVPADLLLVTADGLSVDASTLTGESVPVPAAQGDPAFAGTFVATGAGTGVVEGTGGDTRLASIAQLTASVRHPSSPLTHELNRIVRTIALVAVGVGAAFFGLALLLGTRARDGFLFAIGVTVALVPEGLLPTVTLSLAVGAQRLATRHALVRRLEAVETLGSTTFICTDKTGTITRNEMEVVAVWCPAGPATMKGKGYEPIGSATGSSAALEGASTLATAALIASQGRITRTEEGWEPVGDPMEAAIDVLARRLAGSESSVPLPAVARRYAFDPARRRESALSDGYLVVKGAPDAVLRRCGDSGGILAAADAELAAMAARGLRVLAVARREAAGLDTNLPTAELETDLELLGLLGLEDPPRPNVGEAIRAARAAGIKLAMVTGDHPATARAIAQQVGFVDEDPTVLEGVDLPDDDAELGALVDHDGVVLSRVTPQDKLRVARVLQARGHVVAMTGDGVNDGPALQEADIGVAMGRSGTDVARAAADLVLLDDDFATIVAAVEQGRATFTNIHRFLTYHLTDNVAELTPVVVWALSGGRFPLALGVLQILCLDIGTDLLPALALGIEAPTPGILQRPPEGRHLIDRTLLVRAFGILGPAEAFLEMLAFVATLVAAGWRPGQAFPGGHALLAASGAAFATVVLAQMANAFACRSASRPPGQLGWWTNRFLTWAVIVQVVLLAVFLYPPPIAHLLDHAPPPAAGWIFAIVSMPALLGVDRVHKAFRARRRRATASSPSARHVPSGSARR